jgi:hypothetical protein
MEPEEEIEGVASLSQENLLRFDYKIVSDYARNILIESCETHKKTLKKISELEAKLHCMDVNSKEYAELNLKLDNERGLLEIKIVNLIKFLDKVLYCMSAITKSDVHKYFDLFDATAYFLITFKDIIDIGLFTDLTFLLIKKNSMKRSEDLLYYYRQKLHD